jgi:hypothetical protein
MYRLHEQLLASQGLYSRKLVVCKYRIKWVEHVARIKEIRITYNILIGKRKEKSHLRDLGIDRRTKLKLILKE